MVRYEDKKGKNLKPYLCPQAYRRRIEIELHAQFCNQPWHHGGTPYRMSNETLEC